MPARLCAEARSTRHARWRFRRANVLRGAEDPDREAETRCTVSFSHIARQSFYAQCERRNILHGVG
jgi:hypothetical protein